MSTIKTLLLTLLLLVASSSFADNLAPSGTATATTGDASLAIDGNTATRWESEHGEAGATVDFTQTYVLTLDNSYALGDIKITWEGASADEFTVDISSDNSTWEEVYSITSREGDLVDEISISNKTAQYIRINCNHRNLNAYGYSIYEIEVYEYTTDDKNATLNMIAVDGVDIPDFSSKNLSYSYSVLGGTTTVPTTTATKTISDATLSITPATTIPGTTEIDIISSDGTVNNTYTIYFYEGTPAEAAPTPTLDASDVISVYSDSYTSIATNTNPGWGQSTTFSEEDIAGNSTLKYANLNYQGTEYPSTDVSEMAYIHLDYWTSDATELKFSVISESQENAYDIASNEGITRGQWVSIDIPLTEYTVPDLTQVFQFKTVGNGSIFLDNLYFWKESIDPNKDATLSDLLVNGQTIDNFTSSEQEYIYVISSTSVPTTTATATESGATIDINEANFIPGVTTITVTSADGTVTESYSITYTEQALSKYCERAVTHNNVDATSDNASGYLTITNLDESSFYVQMNPAGEDSIDVLLIQSLPSGFSNVANDTIDDIAIRRTYTTTEVAPDSITIQILWSYTGWGGNNQINEFKVAFNETCTIDPGTVTQVEAAVESLTIYPNPVDNVLFISSNKVISSMNIFNLNGQLMKSVAPTSNSIDVSDLNKGYYITKTVLEDGSIEVNNIIKL